MINVMKTLLNLHPFSHLWHMTNFDPIYTFLDIESKKPKKKTGKKTKEDTPQKVFNYELCDSVKDFETMMFSEYEDIHTTKKRKNILSQLYVEIKIVTNKNNKNWIDIKNTILEHLKNNTKTFSLLLELNEETNASDEDMESTASE